MIKNKIYEVYSNDVKIAEGTQKEIAKIIHCCDSNICSAVKNDALVHNKYRIKEKFVKSDDLDYLYRHLMKYGNTTFRGNPKKYVKQLRQFGITFRYKKSMSGRNDYILERTN